MGILLGDENVLKLDYVTVVQIGKFTKKMLNCILKVGNFLFKNS